MPGLKLHTEEEEKKFKVFMAENPKLGKAKLAKALGITIAVAARLLREVRDGNGVSKTITSVRVTGAGVPNSFHRGVPLEEMKKKLDVLQIVRDGLEKLAEEGKVELDGDFRQELGVPVQVWPDLRQHQEFERNQLLIQKKVWWGSEEHLVELKNLMDLT